MNEAQRPEEAEPYYRLFHALVNTMPNLVVLLRGDTPELFNKAFLDYSGISSTREFLREFGSLPNRFVPHDAYFHAGKAPTRDAWLESLVALPKAERIVSMVSCRAEPHAFSVEVDTSVEGYTILTFTDISQELIKRIMTENDVSIDKRSGAYDREYFLHTGKSFEDAATFNKQRIGITAIELGCSDEEARKLSYRIAAAIKQNIRQTDMLVHWNNHCFLLAYLVEGQENVLAFSNKLLRLLQNDFPTLQVQFGATVQQPRESIATVVGRAEDALKKPDPSGIRLVS